MICYLAICLLPVMLDVCEARLVTLKRQINHINEAHLVTLEQLV